MTRTFLPQIICCSVPPVVKTERVTISDASQKTAVTTKAVPIVQNETRVITLSLCRWMAGLAVTQARYRPHIPSSHQSPCRRRQPQPRTSLRYETRIERNATWSQEMQILVMTGRCPRPSREAEEQQHPDMSIMRVMVHPGAELEERGRCCSRP